MKKGLLLIVFGGLFLLQLTAGNAALSDWKGTPIDTVKIGNQIWAAKNMSIPAPNSFWYERDSIANKDNGRLYFFSAAMSVCPKGWHIPSDSEWQELITYLGGDAVAIPQLLQGGSSHLNLTLSGYRSANSANDLFGKKGESGMYWTSTVQGEQTAYGRVFSATTIENNYYRRANAFSVRLIKDKK